MSPDTAPVKDVQFVSFHVGDSLYGLDIRLVKEVNTNTNITKVQLTKPHLRGLVNIRGQIVLVVDASVLFAGREHELTLDSHLVILKTAQDFEQIDVDDSIDLTKLPDKPVALLVDRIGDVVTVPASATEKAPPHMSEERSRFVKCIVRTETLFLIALDPEQLIVGEPVHTKGNNSQSV